jgi:hypothetical protein
MQLPSLFFALGGLAFTTAAPQSLASRVVADNLYVTFWENGCYDTEPGTSSTFVVNNVDGPSFPEACEINGNYNW